MSVLGFCRSLSVLTDGGKEKGLLLNLSWWKKFRKCLRSGEKLLAITMHYEYSVLFLKNTVESYIKIREVSEFIFLPFQKTLYFYNPSETCDVTHYCNCRFLFSRSCNGSINNWMLLILIEIIGRTFVGPGS